MKKKAMSIMLCMAIAAMSPSMVFADVSIDDNTATFSGTVTDSDFASAASASNVIVSSSNVTVTGSNIDKFVNYNNKFKGLVYYKKAGDIATFSTLSTATNISLTDIEDVFVDNYKPATNTVLTVTATDAVIAKLDKAGFPVRVIKDTKAANLSDDAEINATYYGNFEAAFKDANEGDIITLLAPYSGTPLVYAKGVKINKNGFKANVAEAVVSIAIGGGDAIKCASLQQAYEKLNATITKDATITLLDNIAQNLHVMSNKEVTLDLNGKVLKGNITADGYVVIDDTSETTDSDLTTGEVKGNLYYTDKSHIKIVEGIFEASDENTDIIADGSKGFIMTVNGIDKWIVADEDAARAMTFGLKYEVYDADGAIVTDTDSEPGLDFAVGKTYTAKIYITGKEDLKIRAFDFTATYEPSLIQVEVPYSKNNQYTTLGEEWNKGSMHYTMAVNDNVKTGSDGKVEVAEFIFRINDENKALNVRDAFELGFNKNATIGTMKSINEIPVSKYACTKGFIANVNDGVIIVNYAYAPEGYKLAIISNDTSSSVDKKFNLEGLSADKVYYTENPAYVEQSTNPQGLDIYGNPNGVKGVFLAFVNDTMTKADVESKIGHNSIGYTLFNTTPYLNGNVDVNRDGKVNANDASDVYQMLIYDKATNTGSRWGFEVDNSQLYIPTFERLLSESNFDGKLYGTIEDVNNIINFYTKLNLN